MRSQRTRREMWQRVGVHQRKCQCHRKRVRARTWRMTVWTTTTNTSTASALQTSTAARTGTASPARDSATVSKTAPGERTNSSPPARSTSSHTFAVCSLCFLCSFPIASFFYCFLPLTSSTHFLSLNPFYHTHFFMCILLFVKIGFIFQLIFCTSKCKPSFWG